MELKRILKYLNYRLTAYSEHDLHSPFLYNFYMELIKNEFPFGDFEELNTIRKKIIKDSTVINYKDLGAGSKKLSSDKRLVKQITMHGIAQKKQAEFLYRLLNKFMPATVVELGTSIGLSTLYFSKASPRSDIYTIEGCLDLVEFSKKLFIEQQARNIQNISGHFDTAFPKLLQSLNHLDFLYIDGNHAYEPTMRYFTLALEKKNTNSIFVFDDIYWSAGMQQAWKEISAHPDVMLSLDLFYFGIVFFRTEQKNKEHFVLKF
ncbi:MAG: class I SAM-dependent methyltransferase [Burkholderiales bacterium]|nr:class I SAM-dependent methyltransferase [Bacteroidia bacterium]